MIVDVPPIAALLVDGTGEPERSLPWAEAVDDLRAAEDAAGRGVVPAPLEMLHRGGVDWTLLVIVPEATARRYAGAGAGRVRSGRLQENWAAQLLHAGEDESREDALMRLDRFIHGCGYRPEGPLHEIILDTGDRHRRVLRRAVRNT